MTTVNINDKELTINVIGLDKLWALKSTLTIPTEHILDVGGAEEEAKKWFIGLKFPGTHIPGILSAGTFYSKEGKVFWDVYNTNKAIYIALKNDNFNRLVIEVENPTETISEIRKFIKS